MRHKLISGHRVGYASPRIPDKYEPKKKPAPRRKMSSCAVRVISDPTGTYSHGMFSWPEFKYTYLYGSWPDGIVFDVTLRGRSGNNGRPAGGKKNRRIQVLNGLAFDLDTHKVMIMTSSLAYKWIDPEDKNNLPDSIRDRVAESLPYLETDTQN